MVDLVSLAINVVVSIIILSPVLWLIGRWLVGKEKAKFTDAILIIAIGTIVNAVLGYFLTGILGVIGLIIMLIIWLYLIKHFFDCGWLKALAIAILTVIAFVVILFVLVLLVGGIAFFSMI